MFAKTLPPITSLQLRRLARLLVEVHQHPLLQLVLAVVDGDGVVVPVEAVDQGLNGWLLEVAQH